MLYLLDANLDRHINRGQIDLIGIEIPNSIQIPEARRARDLSML